MGRKRISEWIDTRTPIEALRQGDTAKACSILRSNKPLSQELRGAVADRLEGVARAPKGRPKRAALTLRQALALEFYLQEGLATAKAKVKRWSEATKQEAERELLAQAGFPFSAKHLRKIISEAKKVHAEELADIALWERWQRGEHLSPMEKKRISQSLDD